MNTVFQEYFHKIQEINQLPLDPIAINNLIQEELLNCVMLNVLDKQQPSLFTAHKISLREFNQKYFEKLEPFINHNIFDNKENFNRFMEKAIFVYTISVKDISNNIHNNFWKGTGFELIADGIFE